MEKSKMQLVREERKKKKDVHDHSWVSLRQKEETKYPVK